MADDTDRVEILLEDGLRVRAHPQVAEFVRGIDADGDLVVPLGTPEKPIYHDNGTEFLIPLSLGFAVLSGRPFRESLQLSGYVDEA